MNAQTIISLARTQTYTNGYQILDAQALVYLNLVYSKLVDRINQSVGEEHFADYFLTGTVAWQSEYTLPTVSYTTPGLSNIVRVEVNYSGISTEWRKARPVSMKALDKPLSWYAASQPQSDPFYIIFDTGVQIFPAPTLTLASSLKLYGTYDVVELVLSPSPTSPVIASKWHDVIAIGMEPYIWKSWGKRDQADASSAEFDKKVYDLLNQHQNRKLEPTERIVPDLFHLQGAAFGSNQNPFFGGN